MITWSTTISEYCEQHSLVVSQYEKNSHYLLSISGPGACAGYLHRLIHLQYPHAVRVHDTEDQVIYNLGSVFDLIQNPPQDHPPISLPMIRSLLPKLVANQIVGIQPLLDAFDSQDFSEGSRPSNPSPLQDSNHD